MIPNADHLDMANGGGQFFRRRAEIGGMGTPLALCHEGHVHFQANGEHVNAGRLISWCRRLYLACANTSPDH
jgi:hypothetical protein